jgi:glycolate oxidase FAD binding subunit
MWRGRAGTGGHVDLTDRERAVADAVVAAAAVDPVGSRTHREVGGPPPQAATEVRAPSGVVSYEPGDMTICVGAGTTVEELAVALAAEGQECALDPRDSAATVGGTIAAGLSGLRRPRVGPLRDQVLEVRFVTGDGRLVRGGGPTVKNVTGYDLPRLLVGSLGTLGVLTRVILRCRPIPRLQWWGTTAALPAETAARCPRPSCVLWDGTTTAVLLEGHPDDVRAMARAAALDEAAPVGLPDGTHRGRVSVPAGAVQDLVGALGREDGVRMLGETCTGTVHVASDSMEGLAAARVAAAGFGGWLLREAGAPALDGFGVPLPNASLTARIKAAFDPGAKLAPGRLPFATRPGPVHEPLPQAEGDGRARSRAG